MTPSFGFLFFFGVAAARVCADLDVLEWDVTDAEWYVEDAQWFFDMDCPHPVPDSFRLDRVPRELHRVECSHAGGPAECARKTSQYSRLAKSWQSRVKRQASHEIKEKARCIEATRELETAKAQLERAQQALEECRGGGGGGDKGIAGVDEQPPTITYKSLPYTGPRLVIGKADEFVARIRSGQTKQGYCEVQLDTLEYRNTQTCSRGSRRDIGFDIIIEFEERAKQGSTWHFDFGVDFGLGGAIFVDGQKVKSYAGDIWWARRENHANHLGFKYDFPQGRHQLELIGAEKCCDGPSRVKFCSNCQTEADMQVVSIQTLTDSSR